MDLKYTSEQFSFKKDGEIKCFINKNPTRVLEIDFVFKQYDNNHDRGVYGVTVKYCDGSKASWETWRIWPSDCQRSFCMDKEERYIYSAMWEHAVTCLSIDTGKIIWTSKPARKSTNVILNKNDTLLCFDVNKVLVLSQEGLLLRELKQTKNSDCSRIHYIGDGCVLIRKCVRYWSIVDSEMLEEKYRLPITNVNNDAFIRYAKKDENILIIEIYSHENSVNKDDITSKFLYLKLNDYLVN